MTTWDGNHPADYIARNLDMFFPFVRHVRQEANR